MSLGFGGFYYLCWSVGFWMMVFSPSMTCCLSWWDSIPSGKSHKKTRKKWTSVKMPLSNKTQALQNRNKTLTFDRWAFERLGYFVPSFCYLGVLKNKIQYTQIRTLVLHHLIAKGWNNECLPLPTRICMCFTGIWYSWMTNWFQQQQRQHAGNTETTQLELTVLRTWLPGLTRRRAASAHRWAALMTSAFRPVMGFS